MTSEELKDALIKECPIMYKNVYGEETEYKCIAAIIYKAFKGRIFIEVEIMNNLGYKLTCNPAQIRRKGANDL